MDLNRLWEYCRAAAGADSHSEEQMSLEECFRDTPLPEALNALTRAYLGLEGAMDELPWEEMKLAREDEELREAVRAAALNDLADYQLNAILDALTAPVTIIQGPPGTGKSWLIANLLACLVSPACRAALARLHAVDSADPAPTAAVVSSNNSAMDNVLEKILKEAKKEDPIGYAERFGVKRLDPEAKVKGHKANALLDSFSYLGSYKQRQYWLRNFPGMAARYRFKTHQPNRAFLEDRPIFTSTISSLRNCFKDVSDFDYVIMDESSQVSCLQGLLALRSAKRHLVLLGDDKQLPPVINKELNDLSKTYRDLEPFADRAGHSFLEVCQKQFRSRVKPALLYRHFRCPPDIMNFFARYYAGGDRSLQWKDPDCHLFVHWYEGSYAEEVTIKKTSRERMVIDEIEWGADGPTEPKVKRIPKESSAAKPDAPQKPRPTRLNMREIEIFMQEEWPGVKEKLKEAEELRKRDKQVKDPYSVCIISPYAYPLDVLRERLKPELTVEPVVEGGKGEEAGEGSQLPLYRLIINDAQGMEFHTVYYLPTDDECVVRTGRFCRWPVSQDMRQVNVALSRAKKEFHLICSSRWLHPDIQREAMKRGELKAFLPAMYPQDDRYEDDGEHLQLIALTKYVREIGKEINITRAKTSCVFDGVPRALEEIDADQTAKGKERLQYSTERCFGAFLEEQAPKLGFTVNKSHLLLRDIVPPALWEPKQSDVKALQETALREKALREKWPEKLDLDELTAEKLREYLLDTVCHADFTLIGKDGRARFIEVDGPQHRSSDEQKLRDRKKDFWLGTVLGDSLLRLPTDGSTSCEEAKLRELLSRPGVALDPWASARRSLLDRFSDTLLDCAARLESVCRGETEEKGYDPALLAALNQGSKDRVQACLETRREGGETPDADELLRRYFLCRMGPVNAFVYQFLYRLILLDLEDGEELSACSFGCGSLLDAWALAYARAGLAPAVPEAGERELSWQGADTRAAFGSFLAPDCPAGDREGLNKALDRFRLSPGEFSLSPTQLVGPHMSRDCNVWMFTRDMTPLYELEHLLYRNDAGPISAMLQALEAQGLDRDRYYLCFAHDLSNAKLGHQMTRRIVREVFGKAFKVTDLLDAPNAARMKNGGDDCVRTLLEDLRPYHPWEDNRYLPLYISRCCNKLPEPEKRRDGERSHLQDYDRYFRWADFRQAYQKDQPYGKLCQAGKGLKYAVSTPDYMAIQLIRLDRVKAREDS